MKISNYGEMISRVTGKKLLAYVEFGSYQGDYIAAFEVGDTVELYKGSYGSCSGCDWLERQKSDSGDYESVDDDKAHHYVENEHPFAAIPKSTVNECSIEAFEQMLPANTRKDIYDFDAEILLKKLR